MGNWGSSQLSQGDGGSGPSHQVTASPGSQTAAVLSSVPEELSPYCTYFLFLATVNPFILGDMFSHSVGLRTVS